MKKILLLFAVLFTITASAQIPTSDILASYTFTNRDVTTDDVNLAPLTQIGALQFTNDRFENTQGFASTANAIILNGSHLKRSDINANQLTYSFWVRTSTNSTDEKTIIDDTNRVTSGFGNNQYGNYVYLQNGKIGIRGRVSYNIPNQAPQQKMISSVSTSEVSDGFWHHIVAVIYNQGDVKKINSELWIDGVREDNDFIQNAFFNTTINSSISLRDNFNTTGNVVIGNNRNEDFASEHKYAEGFDDLLIYSRQLTSAEIMQIGMDKGFCYPLENTAFTITDISDSSAKIGQILTVGSVGGPRIKVDFAYHKSSEPFSSATILRNVGISTTLNNLEINEEYKVYIRKECTAESGVYNSFSKFKTFETFGNLYVDKDATGTGDGKSWVNAFTDVQDAITNMRDGQSIFIAEGVYKPTSSNNKSIRFNINRSNISIYGGFAGFETTINQRVKGTNETILSGDLSDNDNGTAFTISDNSERIFLLTNLIDNIIFDGLTIKGANNPTQVGAAIRLGVSNNNITINNCKIEDNVAAGGAGFYRISNGLSSATPLNQFITIKNTIFRNNTASYGTAIYSATSNDLSGVTTTHTIENCLFENNVTNDNTSGQGYLGSSIWIRSLATNVDFISNIYNNTFVNNSDIATRYAASENSTLSLTLDTTKSGASHTVNLGNNIIWDNKTIGNVTALSIAKGSDNSLATINITNSIAEDNFSNIATSNKTNVSDANPLFTDSANSDYTLSATSPGIDSGANTSSATATGATDIAGNLRIFNTTVDMGAYEFGSSSPITTRMLTTNATNGTISFNNNLGNGIYTDGAEVIITAIPDAGYEFINWSGDSASSSNPLTVTMDADKTIVANFIPIQKKLTLNTTNGNITTDIAPTNGTYDAGTIVSLTAVADTGFTFGGWSGDVTGNLNPISITLDSDKSVTATFTPIPQRTLTFVVTNATINASPLPVNGTYDDGTLVTLTVIPDTGYKFDGWAFDASGNANPITITMNSNKRVGAIIGQILRTIQLNAVNGTINISPAGNNVYADGTVLTLTATPDAGYGFVDWDGDVSGNMNPIIITLDGDKTITANFSTTASTSDANKIEVLIYPNPLRNFINIKLDEKIKSGQILDITGKEIKTFKNNKVDTRNISSGIYILKIETESGKIAMKKIIKE